MLIFIGLGRRRKRKRRNKIPRSGTDDLAADSCKTDSSGAFNFLSFSLTQSFILSLSLSLCHFDRVSVFLCDSLSLCLSFTHSLTHSDLTHFLALTHPFTRSLSLTHLSSKNYEKLISSSMKNCIIIFFRFVSRFFLFKIFLSYENLERLEKIPTPNTI